MVVPTSPDPPVKFAMPSCVLLLLLLQPSSPKWGWRLAVLFPIWPALVFALLVPLLPETPGSLMQRGQLAAARAALQEIRGPLVDVEEEFDNIMHAAGVEHGQGQVCAFGGGG
jgi:hypothetical protein